MEDAGKMPALPIKAPTALIETEQLSLNPVNSHRRYFTKALLSSQQKPLLFLQFLPFEADSALIPFPFSITSSSRIYTP